MRQEGVTYIDVGSSRKTQAITGEIYSNPNPGSPANGGPTTFITVPIPAGSLNIDGAIYKLTIHARSTVAAAKTIDVEYPSGTVIATANSAAVGSVFLLEAYIIRISQAVEKTRGITWVTATNGSAPTVNGNFNSVTTDLGTDTSILIKTTTVTGTDLVIDSVIAELFPTGAAE